MKFPNLSQPGMDCRHTYAIIHPAEWQSTQVPLPDRERNHHAAENGRSLGCKPTADWLYPDPNFRRQSSLARFAHGKRRDCQTFARILSRRGVAIKYRKSTTTRRQHPRHGYLLEFQLGRRLDR